MQCYCTVRSWPKYFRISLTISLQVWFCTSPQVDMNLHSCVKVCPNPYRVFFAMTLALATFENKSKTKTDFNFFPVSNCLLQLDLYLSKSLGPLIYFFTYWNILCLFQKVQIHSKNKLKNWRIMTEENMAYYSIYIQLK